MRERAITFGEAPRLTGVICDPGASKRSGRPAFLLLNAGLLHRVGPSRINVTLARVLAEEGFASLRFDFSGVGDSESSRDGQPFQERSVSEARLAMDHLEESRGLGESFVLVGLCSGAEVAHAAAVADPRVVGIVPMDGHVYRTWRYYLHRYVPRLVNARSWINLLSGKTYVVPMIRRLFGSAAPADAQDSVFGMHRPPKQEVEADLRTLVERRVRMLQIFTGGLEELCSYADQFEDSFRSIDFGELLEVDFFPSADHTFRSLEEQKRLARTVVGWARTSWPPPEAPSSGTSEGERPIPRHGRSRNHVR